MVYTRGAADDFDRYDILTEDEGWSWSRILPYLLKNEKWTPQADDHNTNGQFYPAVHGTHGPISQLGIGWMQSTIGGGEHSSSATGYLGPHIIQRPNLHIILHAQVLRLVNWMRSRGSITFEGVEFQYGTSLFIATASKEIILSAGAIGSPRILLSSGIGCHVALGTLGIQTILDLPSVGKNASDHVYFEMSWAVHSNQTADSIRQNNTRFNETLEEWNKSRTGPLVNARPGTHAGWMQLSPNSSAFETHKDPSSGPGAPHIEIFFMVDCVTDSSKPMGPGIPGNFITLTVFRQLGGSQQIDGIKAALKFVSAPVWDGYLGSPTLDFTSMSLTELRTTIRASAEPGLHIVGTAGMSPRGVQWGVVDPDLRVKGVSRLRNSRRSFIKFKTVNGCSLDCIAVWSARWSTYGSRVAAEGGQNGVKYTTRKAFITDLSISSGSAGEVTELSILSITVQKSRLKSKVQYFRLREVHSNNLSPGWDILACN
ncbi:aryl-alcohol-oxidase from pleurotus Eryingii [Mycena olivaceomarginata]|nr:aryl-alcohol-oxidase from pleurotus Eryingii [Mycena olivaceomarginata]